MGEEMYVSATVRCTQVEDADYVLLRSPTHERSSPIGNLICNVYTSYNKETFLRRHERRIHIDPGGPCIRAFLSLSSAAQSSY